jgi:thioredoxin-like negative regulator of GroEL
LIALDRYPEALTLVQPESDNLTRAYCLYKTGRESEAKAVLDQLPNHERDAQLLQAQVVSAFGITAPGYVS